MASLSFIIGLVGNVISILMFASPIGTFRTVIKKKSTENYKGLPYITTLLSTSLWTFYGLLKPGGLLVITVNGTGTALHIVYVILFLIYAPKDIKVKSMKLAGILNIGFFGSVIAIALPAFHGSGRLTFVGVICAGLTIGMYAAPLAAMRTVIKMQSVEYMPFFLSFFQFLNGGVWSAYSVMVKDFYIGIPNAIGFVLGSAQLILYMIYKNKSASPKGIEKMEDEGSAHLVVEMQGFEQDNDDEVQMKHRSLLNKGRSLPVPSRQYSLQKLAKTLSMSPHSSLPTSENQVENGLVKDHQELNPATHQSPMRQY